MTLSIFALPQTKKKKNQALGKFYDFELPKFIIKMKVSQLTWNSHLTCTKNVGMFGIIIINNSKETYIFKYFANHQLVALRNEMTKNEKPSLWERL